MLQGDSGDLYELGKSITNVGTCATCPLCCSSSLSRRGAWRSCHRAYMNSLHWLPITYLIKLKTMHSWAPLVHGQSPAYTKDVMEPIADLAGRTRLRYATPRQYDVPFTRTQFGRRESPVTVRME